MDGSFIEANAVKDSRIPREQLAEAAQLITVCGSICAKWKGRIRWRSQCMNRTSVNAQKYPTATLASQLFERPMDPRLGVCTSYPALRSLEMSVGSSSHSKDKARAVVSIGSRGGMSSATDAPNSANFRAETSTRFSRDPTAWL